MIMTLIGGLIGLAMLGAFLGIMLWWVKALPLIVIVVVVLALLIYDLVMTVRYGEDYAARRRKRPPADEPAPRR
jgi:uncharacterized membrane protein